MKTPAEIIRSIEEFYDVETLELQIRYCKTVLKAAIEETEARSQACPEPVEGTDPEAESQADPDLPDVALAKSGGSANEASTPEGAPNPTKTPKLRPLPLGPVNQCNKTLDMLSEARRYQRLLIK